MAEELYTKNFIPEQTLEDIFYNTQQNINNVKVGGTYVGSTMIGAYYKSAETGARVEILPNPYIGIVCYSSAGSEVFKTIVHGTDIGDVIMGDYSSGKYVMWDDSMATMKLGPNAYVDTRLASTLASAINASGNFIDTNLNTSTKQILGDFTFGASGAIKMITDENNGLWLSPTGILGKKAGATTFAVDTSGNATFAGTLSAASGTLGAITIGTNAWHIDSSGNMWWGSSPTYSGATNRISATGLYQGTFQGGFRTGNDQYLNITGTLVNSYLGMINSSQTLYLKYSSGVPVIQINQTLDASVSQITLSNTGASSAALIDLTQNRNDSLATLGIKMNLSNTGTGNNFAFYFGGSEVVGGAVGGTQDKKIRISIAGTTYYIPCYTA